MKEIITYLHEFNLGSAIVRLLVALMAGGVVGNGRSKRERAAGLRTYMLISLGAAMAVLITLFQYEMLKTAWADTEAAKEFKYDASRLSAAVIAGIGFLGAGIIIKVAHQQVSGLTTATGLFATVCMGLAAGVGFIEVVLIATFIIVLVLNVMAPLEAMFKRRLRNTTLNVEFVSVESIEEILNVIKSRDAVVYDIDIEQTEERNGKHPSAIFILQLSKRKPSHSGMLSAVAELGCVYSVQELIS